MGIYLYVSMYPEALIASMLTPEEFGNYLATGTKKRQSWQEAIFFEVDMDVCGKVFDLSDVKSRCVSHEDGEPKHSIYYSIYRVLERTPFEAVKDLYLATKSGRVLKLEKNRDLPSFDRQCYLYQEIVPVHPRIASSLDPFKFARFITDSNNKIYVPKICFVDLRLGELADDPENGSIHDLPYSQIDHLRECLMQVKRESQKHTKTVNRIQSQSFIYRTINNGFFLADNRETLFYPFPSEKELNTIHYQWWRTATE
ncbi:MAG: hypothetical protein JW881_11620 [Spirochaetales bacterium]|nr:hypothetical protein [Spirochaetales bacterium]